jgi:HTH-type transcriptional regulator/antitoxin HigA
MSEMTNKPISNHKEHLKMLDWIEEQIETGVKKGTPKGDLLEVALILVKDFEDKKYIIPNPDPIEAIKLKMEELGLKNKDLVGKIGSKGYVSSIINKRKPLTLEIARWMHRELGIPTQVLLG